jgi:hypothetical protein
MNDVVFLLPQNTVVYWPDMELSMHQEKVWIEFESSRMLDDLKF